jgi:hypothetical protein
MMVDNEFIARETKENAGVISQKDADRYLSDCVKVNVTIPDISREAQNTVMTTSSTPWYEGFDIEGFVEFMYENGSICTVEEVKEDEDVWRWEVMEWHNSINAQPDVTENTDIGV